MIEIWTEILPNEYGWHPDNYLGGTPEFYVNTAENLEDVIVYYDGEPCEVNDVIYAPRKEFMGDDIVLACNSKPPKMGKYNIAWVNWYGKKDKEYLEFDERIVQSPFHKKVFGDNSRIVPLSVKKEQFKDPDKTEGLCLYSSAPDRGGKFLDEIWSDVMKETGARLVKTYDKSICEEEMIDLYKQSQFWLHPCQGIELFCIAAAKAQVAKCIPVVVPNMALETTVKYGVKTDIEDYKDALINAIKNPPEPEDVDFGTWEGVTKELFKNVIDHSS